jgi:hypothetical protein
LGRLALSYVAGEAGEDLCAMFAHEAAKVRAYEQTADFVKDINESPKTQDGKIKCLVADHTICAQLVKEHHHLALIYNDPTRSGIELSIAAAVHRDEPDLLNLINMCMAVMKNTGYFKNLYSHHSDAKYLRQLRALVADENDKDRQRPQIIDEYMRARRHRSPGLKPGELRRLGTIHMHVDGGGKSDLVLDVVKALEKRGTKGKLSVITRSVAGPQREQYPDVYKIHTPGVDDEESLEYFSTTGLADRKDAIETIKLILPQLMEHPGAVLEVECVIGTIFDGEWRHAKGASPIRPEEVQFDKSPTLPFEIHHAFDVPMEAGPALDLDKLLADVTELGISVGGWFTFLKNEREWSYRSNAFVERVHLEEYTMTEYKKLTEYLKKRKIQARQWTIVEEVLGIWKIPAGASA